MKYGRFHCKCVLEIRNTEGVYIIEIQAAKINQYQINSTSEVIISPLGHI